MSTACTARAGRARCSAFQRWPSIQVQPSSKPPSAFRAAPAVLADFHQMEQSATFTDHKVCWYVKPGSPKQGLHLGMNPFVIDFWRVSQQVSVRTKLRSGILRVCFTTLNSLDRAARQNWGARRSYKLSDGFKALWKHPHASMGRAHQIVKEFIKPRAEFLGL